MFTLCCCEQMGWMCLLSGTWFLISRLVEECVCCYWMLKPILCSPWIRWTWQEGLQSPGAIVLHLMSMCGLLIDRCITLAPQWDDWQRQADECSFFLKNVWDGWNGWNGGLMVDRCFCLEWILLPSLHRLNHWLLWCAMKSMVSISCAMYCCIGSTNKH